MMAEQSYLINKHEERAGSFFLGGGSVFFKYTTDTTEESMGERKSKDKRFQNDKNLCLSYEINH